MHSTPYAAAQSSITARAARVEVSLHVIVISLFPRPALASYNTGSYHITLVTVVLAVISVGAAFVAYLAAVQSAVSLYLWLRPSPLRDENWCRGLRRRVFVRSLLVGLLCPLVWVPFLYPIKWLWTSLSSLL